MKKEFKAPIVEAKELETNAVMNLFGGSDDRILTTSWEDPDTDTNKAYKIWKGLK